MKYLGIDYGKKKVGLAISEGISATALKVLDVTSLIDAVNKIEKIVQNEEVTTVVIGFSESGESLRITKSFIRSLQERVPNIQIIEVLETLSTKRAEEQMIQLGTTKKSRRRDDAEAAVIILEDYLDSIRT